MQVAPSRLWRNPRSSAYICPSCRHSAQAAAASTRLSRDNYNSRGHSRHASALSRTHPSQRDDIHTQQTSKRPSAVPLAAERPRTARVEKHTFSLTRITAATDAYERTSLGSHVSLQDRRPVQPHPQVTAGRCSQRRHLHQIRAHKQQLTTEPQAVDDLPFLHKPGGIRKQLQEWQKIHGETPVEEILFPTDIPSINDPEPNQTRLGDGNARTVPSEEDEDIDSINEEDPEMNGSKTATELHLVKGDLVLLKPDTTVKERVLLAVFVRRSGPILQFYTVQGKWSHGRDKHVRFRLGNWIAPDLIDRIIPFLPTEQEMIDGSAKMRAAVEDTNVPREIGLPIVEKLTAFEQEAAQYYRQHATVLDTAHEALAHEDNLRYSTVTSIAMFLLKLKREEVTPVILYVVSHVLQTAGFAFFFDVSTHRITGLLQIRSKNQVNAVNEVVVWIREWQDSLIRAASGGTAKLPANNPMPKFFEKAKRIVLKSRETRAGATDHDVIGPSSTILTLTPTQRSVEVTYGEPFSKDEQTILSFLEMYCCSKLFKNEPRYAALASLVITGVGLHRDDQRIDMVAAYQFLQEIGMILPYENARQYDPVLALPTSRHSKPLLDLAMKLLKQSDDGYKFTDHMKDLRHDWGDLPVYCIDGEGAREIDDGISIEPGNTLSERWLRIHIANPTAFLQKDDDIAKMARHMGETVYFPDRNHMMVPPRASQKWWSLAPSRPALTFSARINEQGAILETDIRPSIVRKVVRLTYDELRKIIDPSFVAEPQVEMVVGGNVPTHKSAPKRTVLSSAPEEDFRAMADVANIRLAYRMANGGVLLDRKSAEIQVWTQWSNNGLEFLPLHRGSARHVAGDPVIRVTVPKYRGMFSVSGSTSDTIVQEFMLLACEIASRWCAERQIPTLHRGSHFSPGQSYDHEAYWREECLPAMEKHGDLPTHIGIPYLQKMGFVAISSSPRKHQTLGLYNYSKVTSPLRRYGDMIAHWQVEAAIREESRLGRSLVTTDPQADRAFLPFSKATLESFMISYQLRERLISHAKAASEKVWYRQMLVRAHHYGQAKLPYDTYKVYVHKVAGDGEQTAIAMELNLVIAIWQPKTQGIQDKFQLGDVWEARLDHVNMRGVYLAPIRLLERYE